MLQKKKLKAFANKAEKIYSHVKKLTRSKVFNNWFSFVIATFAILSVTNVSAQAPDGVDVNGIDETQTWTNVEWVNAVAGHEGESVLTSQTKEIAAALEAAVIVADPTIMEGYQAALNKYGDEVTPSMKYGLIWSVNALNVDLLNNHPSVDVVAHLTEEWVPGYDVSSTGLYAQDGFTFLQDTNLSDLWEKTRLISYAAFVVVLIAAGFMIMFRQKIGGQMMVTVFNTIPKVIVGLFLVTFSFAIVGIIIDIGAVLIRVVASVLNTGADPIVVNSPFSLIAVLFRGASGDLSVTVTGVAGTLGIAGIVGGLLAGGAMTLIVGGILSLVIALVVIGIVFMASLKVFTTLFKAYLGIIMDTVMAPIYLTLAVIPGKESIGQDWFNRVLKNVLTFVGVFFIINLAMYLRIQDVNFSFPRALAGGTAAATTDTTILGFLIQQIMPLFLFFMAAEVPNFISDFLPQGGGKGAASAMQGVQKSFGKIPVIGSFFG